MYSFVSQMNEEHPCFDFISLSLTILELSKKRHYFSALPYLTNLSTSYYVYNSPMYIIRGQLPYERSCETTVFVQCSSLLTTNTDQSTMHYYLACNYICTQLLTYTVHVQTVPLHGE